ncbi:MAG: DUF4190 domain-containing protein [Candidatus Hydrogenedentes bacterium]|nr:DUF4190 domain-containing protein [Candidatus Hydrogenedentota bacterium]
MQVPPLPPEPAPERCALASWSLYLGIASHVVCNYFTAIPSIICGHMALRRINDSGGRLQGKNIAYWGLAIGYAGLFLSIVLTLLLWFVWVKRELFFGTWETFQGF